jgi:hypothetical protein
VAYEAEINAKGERLIWLEWKWADKLGGMLARRFGGSDIHRFRVPYGRSSNLRLA